MSNEKDADKSLQLKSVVGDMLDISEFAYTFRTVRDVVRDHGETVGDGRDCKTERGVEHGDADEEAKEAASSSSWLSWLCPKKEVKRVKFERPELIITDKGGATNENRNFSYAVTPAAILEFMQENRKFFKEKDGDIFFDEDEKENKLPLCFEKSLSQQIDENMKILDFDDSFSTDVGGLVYGLILNVTHEWVCVVFRGTIGATDITTDRNFVLDHVPYKKCTTEVQKPGSHMGFTEYLYKERECDSIHRPVIDRIIASVSDAFEKNPEVTPEFKLYTTGHSLGGGLSNLFAFQVAHKKEKEDEAVKHFPKKITAMTFAAPVVGNECFNKEYRSLEKEGFLRHIRVSNEGDLVPTNNIPLPFSLAINGNSRNYAQNGMNLFLMANGKMEIGYCNTKTCASQLKWNPMNNLKNHLFPEYRRRVGLEVNKEVYEQTVEELYKEAMEFW